MSDTLTGLQQHLRDVHKNEAAGNLTMTQALSYHAQEHLSTGGVRNHSEPRQLHRALAYQLAEIQGLEVPKQDIANFLDQVLEGRIRGDHENEREAIEADLNRHPEGWVTRARPKWQLELDAFRAWLETLSADQRWAHCGNREQHTSHEHTVSFSGETPNPHVPCVGTPDVMATPLSRLTASQVAQQSVATMLDGLERARAQRPGSQPLPVPRKDIPGAHDMVIADLHNIMARRQVALRNAGQTKEANAVRQLMNEIEADLKRRRALGLERYGSLLQPGNGRDPLRDAYEEVVDLVAYFRQLIMARDEAVTLLTELLADHAVGEDAIVREKVGRAIYLLAGEIKKEVEKGSNDD